MLFLGEIFEITIQDDYVNHTKYCITLENTHYFVDLVFYHRILKCFVIIDLKKEKAGYEDVGQMNMYLIPIL